jgi:hypothetical protein
MGRIKGFYKIKSSPDNNRMLDLSGLLSIFLPTAYCKLLSARLAAGQASPLSLVKYPEHGYFIKISFS